MNSISHLSFASHPNAFERGLSLDAVRTRAPAVFAASADEGLSSKYTFIPLCGRCVYVAFGAPAPKTRRDRGSNATLAAEPSVKCI
jgi:hypothetical protein